jgi:SAM-dependent methyltransferase
VLSNVLEHIADDGEAVRTFARILPPGGRLIIYVPALPAVFGAIDEAVGHHRRYLPGSLRAAIEGNGFELTTLRWMNVVGIPGWYVNGKLLRRRSPPPLQLRLYDAVAPWLARAESMISLPIGNNLLAVSRRR